jgi:hypothetical protein
MSKNAFFEPLRSLPFGGISVVYAPLGTPLAHRVSGFCITNNTSGDMIVTTDDTVVAGEMFVAAGSYKLWDVQANMNAQFDDEYVFPIGTQVSVKQSTAPVDGAVYLEVLC